MEKQACETGMTNRKALLRDDFYDLPLPGQGYFNILVQTGAQINRL